MHDDYMPEIHLLKARVDKLEYKLPRLSLKPVQDHAKKVSISPPIIRYVQSDDDDKIAELMKHVNDHYQDVNKHLAEIDDALVAFINSTGVGSAVVIKYC